MPHMTGMEAAKAIRRMDHGVTLVFVTNMAQYAVEGYAVEAFDYIIGMLTDSRSLLSYARHEYFRRILCALLGHWVENGEYPADMDTLGGLVQDICCNNARRYFNL